MQFVLIACKKVEGCRNILKLSCRLLAFTSHKAFLWNEKRSGTSLSASFWAWFLKKNISVVILYWLTKFHWLPLFYEILGNICIVIFVNQVVTSLKLTLTYMIKNSRQKDEYLRKKILRQNGKHFSPVLKGFHWSK